MKLSAPTQPLFIVAVILGLAGMLMHFGVIPLIAGAQPIILIMLAFVLLTVGCLFKGV